MGGGDVQLGGINVGGQVAGSGELYRQQLAVGGRRTADVPHRAHDVEGGFSLGRRVIGES